MESFFFYSHPSTIYGDIYVTSTFPFIRNDPNLLVFSNIYPSGVYNLPTPKTGNYLVFMPLDTSDPGWFGLTEIRVWSMKDLAQLGTVVNSFPQVVGALGEQYPPNWAGYTSNFYVDLGSVNTIQGIWILHSYAFSQQFCVNYDTVAPLYNTDFIPQNAICYQQNFNDEEIWISTPSVSTRYIFMCVTDGLYCMASWSFEVRRIAVFAPSSSDSCITTTTTINTQTFSTPIAYQVIYTLPNTQTVLSFNMNTDSAGITAANAMKCGAKKYTTNYNWATVLAPADPLTQPFELQINTNQFVAATVPVTITIGFVNPAYTAQITQSVTISFLHPCKQTSITSNETIPTLQYFFGDPPLTYAFSAFSNSAATQYGNPGLCSLVYKLSLATDATTFGVSISSLTINVSTNNQSLIGQSILLYLYGEEVSVQVPPSQQVPFTVQIVDPCPNTAIQLPFSTIANMNYAVAANAITQTFGLGTDSKSALTSLPGLCGPIAYSITQAYSFATIVISTSGTISVQTSQIQDVGVHVATFDAKLTNYSSVAHVQIDFTITISNPCLSTTLTLPTTLTAVTITSLSGISSSQVFAPATDSAATTMAIPALCGNRVYSIVEAQALSFVSIEPPAVGLDPVVNNWTLTCLSTNLADVGLWTVTLKAELQLYSTITPVTSIVSVTVLHICVNTTITTSQTIANINYILGDSMIEISFAAFSDSVSAEYQMPTLCALTYSLAAAADATTFGVSVNSSTLKISVYSLTPSLIGQSKSFQLSANSSIAQQATASSIVTFTVYVLDPCPYASISLSFSTLQNMSYSVAASAVIQTFALGTDSKSTLFATFEICGPLAYSIVENYSFVTLTTISDPGVISVHTNSLLDVNVHNATLRVKLTRYAAVSAVEMAFTITISNPCLSTALRLPTTITPFTIYLTNETTISQTFLPATDTAGVAALIPGLCGVRIYSIVESEPTNFIMIRAPSGDQYVDSWQLSFLTNKISKVGVYTVTIKVVLQDYAQIEPATSTFQVTVDATLLDQDCDPTGFTLTPSVVSISILGKPQFISWKMNSKQKDCGTYSITVERDYALLFSVVEQKLVASAPKSTKTGSFSPLITLKRDSKPAQQVTTSLSLTVTNCLVTQLSFSQPPTSSVTVDLASYTEPITVPFDTKQTPLCDNKVFFTLAPIQKFLSVTSSSITGGQILVQEEQVSTMLVYTVKLRAFVDGQTAEASLNVIFSPKPAPTQETNNDLPDESVATPSSDTAQTTNSPTEGTGWSPEVKKTAKKLPRQDFPLTGNPSSISMSGGFVFEFSMPLNLTSLENMGFWNSTNKGQDYFKFQLIPGDQKFFFENEEAYAYSWNITRITNTTIAFQIQFAQYMIVSQSQTDKMRFKILQPKAFVSQINGRHIDFTSSLHNLPKQVKSIEEQQLIQSIESKLDRFLKTLSAQSLLNILLSQSLHLLWGMVNTQQIIVINVLFNLKTPVNAQKIEILILRIVSFDLFKMDALFQRIFKFDLEASHPLNSKFSEANYETSNFLLNMGDMFLVEIIYVLFIGLVPLTRWLVDGQFPRIERYLKSFKVFNNFIRFYLESQMEICICALLSFRQMNKQSWRKPQLWFANLYASGNLCMLVIMPFILGYVALRYHKRYRIDRHYREQYDDIFGELRGDRKLPMLYFCFFTLRRYTIACSLIGMPDNYLFQIFLHIFSSFGFLTVLLLEKLHKDAKKTKKEIFDEATILMTGYFLFLFTDFVSESDQKSQIGWALVTLILTHLAINVSLMLLESFIAYKQKIRQIWFNYKLRKLRRERFEAMEASNQALAIHGPSLNQSERVREFQEPIPNQQLQQRAQVWQERSQSEEQKAEQMQRGLSSAEENQQRQQPEESESEHKESESESEQSESESEESQSESEENESEYKQQQEEENKQQQNQQRPQESKIESDQLVEQKVSRKRFEPFTLQNDQIKKQNPLKSTKLFWPVPPDEIDPELYEIYGPSNLQATMKKTEQELQPERQPIQKLTGPIDPEEMEKEIRAFAKQIPAVFRRLSPSELKRH